MSTAAVTTTPLARLTVRARTELVVAARDFACAVAAQQGFPATALERLELLTEEACLFVVEHGFEPGEDGSFDLILDRRPGKFVVAVEDKGLPIDFSKPPEESTLGLSLMRGFAEEISFLNLGKAGRRIEFAASLPARPVEDYLTAAERAAPTADPPLASDVPKLRLMTEADAVALARCIYRAYGYTYVDFIYYPDRIAEMLRSGLMMSCIAENDASEIVGHLALLRGPEQVIAESGIAVVDPRYRGHALFKTMKLFMVEEARRRGLLGLYSEAMTLHPFTQKGNIALGAHETGFMLAYVPPDVNTRKIDSAPQGERAALLLYYYRIAPEPHRVVYAPPHHRAILQDICARIGLDRRFVDQDAAPPPVAEATRLDVRVRPELGVATITVRACGADAAQQVRHHLVDLCRRKIDTIYLDLPLGDPVAARVCAACEAAGFFFSGMIPEYDHGDVLRLQYLNNLDIRMEGIVVVSDAGRRLFDHVAAERRRVGEGARVEAVA
uniref:Putative anti-sigma regulatory factor, serine/threonine protein kinase n=1 Tax=Rhodopseudomonas palustris (strain BisA53) TaxID=316055 RepID=Q07JQ4_RHOP5